MGSFLYDGSAINDKNLIRIFNRRQSMGNRYDRFPMCQRGNRLLILPFWEYAPALRWVE